MNLIQKKSFLPMLIILLLGIILYLIPSVIIPFHTKGEPREALVAMSMLQHDNFILAYTNGTDIAYKPPFFHWCIAFFSWLFQAGEVSEWTSRFPSVLFSVGMGLFVYHALTRYFKGISSHMALLTVFICLTNVEWSRASWACRVDMVNSAIMVVNIFLLHRLAFVTWRQSWLKNTGAIVALTLLMAAGFLTKGPVGVVLPVGIVTIILLAAYYKTPKYFLQRFVLILCPAILASGLSACWYIAAIHEGGDRFIDLILDENVRRFLGKMTYTSHNEPVYYNLLTLASGFLPYTVLLLLSLFTVRTKGKGCFWHPSFDRIRPLLNRISAHCRESENFHPLAIASILIILIFYSIPSSKRSVYILPMYPFLSYYIARCIQYLDADHAKYIRGYIHFLSVIAVLLILIPPLIASGVIPTNLLAGKHADENMAMMQLLGQIHTDYWLLLFILLVSLYAIRKHRDVVGMMVLTFSILTVTYSCILPRVLSLKSDKLMAEAISQVVGPQDLVYEYRSEFEPKNRLHYFTVNFYLGGRMSPYGETDLEHQTHQPRKGFVMMSPDDEEIFLQHFPTVRLQALDYGGSIQPIGDKSYGIPLHDKRSCDDGKPIRLYIYEQMSEGKQTMTIDK